MYLPFVCFKPATSCFHLMPLRERQRAVDLYLLCYFDFSRSLSQPPLDVFSRLTNPCLLSCFLPECFSVLLIISVAFLQIFFHSASSVVTRGICTAQDPIRGQTLSAAIRWLADPEYTADTCLGSECWEYPSDLCCASDFLALILLLLLFLIMQILDHSSEILQ